MVDVLVFDSHVAEDCLSVGKGPVTLGAVVLVHVIREVQAEEIFIEVFAVVVGQGIDTAESFLTDLAIVF